MLLRGKLATTSICWLLARIAARRQTAAAALEGATKILSADSAEYGHSLAENLAPLVAGIAGDYSHILAPATTFGKNVMPRIAALCDVPQISDIIELLMATPSSGQSMLAMRWPLCNLMTI